MANQRCYGSRRIVDELKAQYIDLGRYIVRRLIHEAGFKSVWKKKFVNTTYSKHDLSVAADLLNRRFNPPESNQAGTSDITYICTKSGWLYLAAVMGLYSRKIIAWAINPTMPAALICQALQMATGQVTEHIVGFYNCTWQHAALENLAPIIYETQFAAKQPIKVSVIT
ncbi:IS3 family transposase [Candidatus Nitrotoga sp. M5]|uniref:IS3 family transposase n=1 Tax=Candidatus Nitrotoga sp. M5 TaxID=2890409 RepID=UPI001EF66D7B|nr:IS3 family transposase [Candidatus Nitrotoga sp. M5]